MILHVMNRVFKMEMEMGKISITMKSVIKMFILKEKEKWQKLRKFFEEVGKYNNYSFITCFLSHGKQVEIAYSEEKRISARTY